MIMSVPTRVSIANQVMNVFVFHQRSGKGREEMHRWIFRKSVSATI